MVRPGCERSGRAEPGGCGGEGGGGVAAGSAGAGGLGEQRRRLPVDAGGDVRAGRVPGREQRVDRAVGEGRADHRGGGGGGGALEPDGEVHRRARAALRPRAAGRAEATHRESARQRRLVLQRALDDRLRAAVRDVERGGAPRLSTAVAAVGGGVAARAGRAVPPDGGGQALPHGRGDGRAGRRRDRMVPARVAAPARRRRVRRSDPCVGRAVGGERGGRAPVIVRGAAILRAWTKRPTWKRLTRTWTTSDCR